MKKINKKLAKFGIVFLSSTALILPTSLLIACGSNDSNAGGVVPPAPSPTPPPIVPPIEPDQPIDRDPIKRTINVPYLENLIQTNDFGYNPDSLHKTILKYQKENNMEFLNHILTDKQISNWGSIQNLKFIPNDKAGTLSLSFDYGGTHSYSVDLTKANGLLSDADYYEKLDDLSFAYRINYSSIASGRNFPVLDGSGNVMKNSEAMARAQYRDGNKGTWINEDNKYITSYNNTGTAWLVDYIPSKVDQDFHEFIVATNIHVSDMSGAFYLPMPTAGVIKPGHSFEIALDPIFIDATWAKPNGKLNFENPNTFSADNFIDADTRYPINNLTFQKDIYGMGDRDIKFRENVLKDQSRLNKEDKDAFSTWDHPTTSSASKQKQSILESISFYEPTYTATYDWKENDLSSYWQNQLKDNSVTYNNVQPDLTFLKMQFNENDLRKQWPKLLNAIEANKMDQYLLPLATRAMNPEDDISHYYAGFPHYYNDLDPKSVDSQRQAYNGYYDSTHKQYGAYYRWGKTYPKIFDKDGVMKKFDVYPNTLDFDYVNDAISYQMDGHYVMGEESYADRESDRLLLRFERKRILKKWTAYDEKIIKQTLLKQVYVETKSDYVNNYITKPPYSEANASSQTRGMIKATVNGAKKYWWGTSEFIMGGNSGSMVLTPKMEIGGIISSRLSDSSNNIVLQCLIESMVNTADNIVDGDKVIWKGVQKKLKSSNIKTVLYNK